MLYAVLVHHILAEDVQNKRQAPYRTPAYFLSSSPLNLVHSLSAEEGMSARRLPPGPQCGADDPRGASMRRGRRPPAAGGGQT